MISSGSTVKQEVLHVCSGVAIQRFIEGAGSLFSRLPDSLAHRYAAFRIKLWLR
ncbi:hypothetical protein SV7mr_03340 [Stieleria bergensis]|uniref:Uncharacterized protein n=1 Tax=Stieleria bergensis TaxID=2528025 RepID=A0A517SNZ9_9BACT|nr:hypothetical protein SV7mr_03340 [Planctomycetes bacterium SV_7m_r]